MYILIEYINSFVKKKSGYPTKDLPLNIYKRLWQS